MQSFGNKQTQQAKCADFHYVRTSMYKSSRSQ